MTLIIEIDLPESSEIVNSGCPVPIARKGEKWNNSCLGEMQNHKGVYVIHHAGKVKYVGKTDGLTMDFATRLRRHFGEVASGNKHTYPKLSTLELPPHIMVRCFSLPEIKERMKFNGVTSEKFNHMVGIFEIAMINHLEPEYQQHAFEAAVKQLTKAMGRTIAQGITADEVRDWKI